MKKLLILMFVLLSGTQIYAQNNGVLISTNSSATPDASAILEVKSTSQGMLIPRVDISDLSTAAPVTSPATSLLVYNTNTTTGPGFFYWDGSAWVSATGAKKLDDLSDAKSDGFYDVFIGKNAGGNVTTVSRNVGIGPFALRNVSGKWNVGVGRSAGTDLTTGEENTFLGYDAGTKVTTGTNNTLVGSTSGYTFTSSSYNTYIGSHSGFNATGSSNILIGYNIETSATSANNEMNIGNALFGTNIYPASGTSSHIGINTQTPDASAALDIFSNNTGLLIPRVDISDLSTPAPMSSVVTSLLAYNTNTTTGPGFFYWNGSAWTTLSGAKSINDLSDGIGADASGNGTNYIIGHLSGTFLSTGTKNTSLGYGSFGTLADGNNNTALGYSSGGVVTSGSSNLFLGYQSGDATSNGTATGDYNILIGYQTEASSSSASEELNIGYTIYATGLYTNSAKVGIGNGNNAPTATLDVDGDVKVTTSINIGTAIHLTPGSAPSSPTEGDMYMDATSHKLMVYDGTTWQACW